MSIEPEQNVQLEPFVDERALSYAELIHGGARTVESVRKTGRLSITNAQYYELLQQAPNADSSNPESLDEVSREIFDTLSILLDDLRMTSDPRGRRLGVKSKVGDLAEQRAWLEFTVDGTTLPEEIEHGTRFQIDPDGNVYQDRGTRRADKRSNVLGIIENARARAGLDDGTLAKLRDDLVEKSHYSLVGPKWKKALLDFLKGLASSSRTVDYSYGDKSGLDVTRWDGDNGKRLSYRFPPRIYVGADGHKKTDRYIKTAWMD